MDQDEILLDTEERMQKAADVFHTQLQGIRTGRATPGLVDSIRVDYYGSQTPIKQMASVTVQEGSPVPSAPAAPSAPPKGTVSLTVVGDPSTGPWGVNATTTSTQDVMADVRLDGVKHHVEYDAPYDLFPNLYGTGSHAVEFVFYLQGTTSEIGRASITVKEGG